MAIIYHNLGIVHENMDRFMTAIDNYHRAARVIEKLNRDKSSWMASI